MNFFTIFKFLDMPLYIYKSVCVCLFFQTNRTAFMCFQTYQRYISKTFRRKEWTEEENEILRKLVEKMKIGNFIPYIQSETIGSSWALVLNVAYLFLKHFILTLKSDWISQIQYKIVDIYIYIYIYIYCGGRSKRQTQWAWRQASERLLLNRNNKIKCPKGIKCPK